MVQVGEVNEAMIQHAASELEVGAPIRAWRVEDGELVLVLAYGGEVRWREAEVTAKTQGAQREKSEERPWRFVKVAKVGGRSGSRTAPTIPGGDLNKLTKQKLQLIALAHGFQTRSLAPRKAEFVEALGWLRERLGGGD